MERNLFNDNRFNIQNMPNRNSHREWVYRDIPPKERIYFHENVRATIYDLLHYITGKTLCILTRRKGIFGSFSLFIQAPCTGNRI